jgi:deoxyguanosine kinase
MNMSIAYLLSGSNLGNRWENLCNAAAAIRRLEVKVEQLSPVYESPAWGFDHPEAFLNQAIKLTTSLSPDDLLKCILEIENQLGRKRSAGGYEARTIDIDILFYDDRIINSNDLIIPHPRLHLRKFALVPISTIDNDLIHPGFNKSIGQLLKECQDQSQIQAYTVFETCAEEGGIGDAV